MTSVAIPATHDLHGHYAERRAVVDAAKRYANGQTDSAEVIAAVACAERAGHAPPQRRAMFFPARWSVMNPNTGARAYSGSDFRRPSWPKPNDRTHQWSSWESREEAEAVARQLGGVVAMVFR